MHLSTARLREFYANQDVQIHSGTETKIRSFSNHPLLKSCLSSLIPYFEMKDLPETIANLKIAEAINILRSIDLSIDQVLANFE